MRKRISTTDLSQLEPRRVCIIKPSSLGDVVQALPVLCALRDRWPKARFSWVVNRNLSGLLVGHRSLDEVIPFDRASRGARRLAAVLALRRRLRAADFDVVCDLQGLLRSGVMAWATRAAVRVGLSNSREYAHRFYSYEVEIPDPDMPAVDRYLQLAAAFGADTTKPRFDLSISPNDAEWAAARCATLPRPTLVISPGARWKTKRWPAEQFGTIGCRAVREFGAGVIVVGSKDERTIAETVVGHAGRDCLNLAGKTSLKQLAAVLARADLVLSNDSGPMHLAAAVGTPVVGIFTCTSPRRAGPFGSDHCVVATSVACAASYLKRCDRLDCMRELAPDRVWPHVAQMLAQREVRAAGPHRKTSSAEVSGAT